MKKLLVSTLLLMGGMSMQAQAAGSEALIKQNLQKVNARIQVESISEAPVKGMYEVMLNTGEVLYSDEKGEYFLLGKLYQFREQEGFVDLTEQKQSALRKEALAKIPAEQIKKAGPDILFISSNFEYYGGSSSSGPAPPPTSPRVRSPPAFAPGARRPPPPRAAWRASGRLEMPEEAVADADWI